jgi:hypothetical protein
MKLKLFEYCILFHPNEKDEGVKTEKIKGIDTVLAKDEKQAAILVSREIPSNYLDQLERVDIIIRPF